MASSNLDFPHRHCPSTGLAMKQEHMNAYHCSRIFRLRVVAWLTVLALLAAPPSTPAASVAAQGSSPHTVLFTLPIGADGVHYMNVGVQDAFPLGPQAIAIGADRSVWLADSVGNRLLQYDMAGRRLGVINFDGLAYGSSDLEATRSDVLVLVEAAQQPTVLRFSHQGKLLASYPIPPSITQGADAVNGLALGTHGEVLVEMIGKVYQFVDARGKLAPKPLAGYPYRGLVYTVEPASQTSRYRGYIVAGNRRIEVVTRKPMMGLWLLAVNPDGSFYVLVHQDISVPNGPLHIHQAVRHYSAKEKFLSSAQVPLEENITSIEHAFAVGPDQAVYRLVTRPAHVEVQRLRFIPK